jgi:hypothetical protein
MPDPLSSPFLLVAVTLASWIVRVPMPEFAPFERAAPVPIPDPPNFALVLVPVTFAFRILRVPMLEFAQ